jgi:CRP-like cAMP-binding protein
VTINHSDGLKFRGDAMKDVLRDSGALGRVYLDGEVIIRQGDVGDCMFVIQEGQVEVLAESEGEEVRLNVLDAGDFFGEMAVVEREVRAATVRALGAARILTVDRKNFLRRIHEDPSLAYRLVQTMSRRIRELDKEVARLRRRG